MVMYGNVWLCRAMYGCVGLCMVEYGHVGLCKAIEGNVCHILSNGEPLYYAYTTYLPKYPRETGRLSARQCEEPASHATVFLRRDLSV